MVTCNICFEATQEVGEIDSCYHRFCWPCINQWADRDSRCPLCKQRFLCIKRKALQTRNSFGEPSSKRYKPNSQSSETANSPSTPPQPGDVGTTADASEAAAAIAAAFGGPSEEPGSPKGELHGVVLETRKVRKKDQAYIPEDDAEDLQELVANLHCLVCGADDNDEFLLICDGCDGGYHTYCVDRRTVPLGDWFCPSCMEQHSLQENQHQQRRAERQQRRHQQDLHRTPTEQQANTAAATAADVGRRRLQRGAGAAGDFSDDEVDLTLEDSDLDVSDSTAAGVWPRRRRAASIRSRHALGDSDRDYDLQDEADLAAADYSDTDDAQDSDWGGDESWASQGNTRVQGPRGTHHALTGTRRVAAGVAAAGHSPSAARPGRLRQAASYSTGRGAYTGTAVTPQRRARSAAHAAAMGAAETRPTDVVARDGRRLKTWQELRAEEGATAVVGAATSNAGPISTDNGGPTAAATVRTSVQIADLMKAVNQERRSRQSQVAASGATMGSSSSSDPESQAWAALNSVRSAGREHHSSRGRSCSASAASAAHTGSARAAPAATAEGRQGVASSYFSSGQRQQQPSPRAGQGSSSAYSTQQQQQQVQLRQALAARLQQQKQLKRQELLARDQSHQQLADSDPRDPGYVDIIRDSVATARNKGEEDRRRRALAEMTTAARLLPAATVPARTANRRDATAARRIACSQADVAQPAAAGAARQPVSRLAMRLSAAQQRGLERQRQWSRQPEVGRTDSSSNFMARWLSTGASSRDAGRPAAAGIGSSQNERVDLPRSVRTLGSVKRGAAVQAAAAAAAPLHDDFRSSPGAASRSGQQQQQQASRQPLELRPSQQQQHVPQRKRHQTTEVELEVHAIKEDPLKQPHSSSRYFADHSQTIENQLQQQHRSRWWHHLVQLHHRYGLLETRQIGGPQIPVTDVVGAAELQHSSTPVPWLQQYHQGPIGDGLQQQQQQLRDSLHHLAPYSASGIPESHSPMAGTTKWQQNGVVPHHLLYNLQPGHSNTSNSSGTTCQAGVDGAGGLQGGGTIVGASCSAGVLPVPVFQQQMTDMDMVGSSSSAAVLPGQVLQPVQDHLFAAHQQQQPMLCSVQLVDGNTWQITQIPPAGPFTREQLKFIKDASADIVKAKLRPLLRSRKITEQLYTHAAQTASRGLYDQVKRGAIQYDAVEAAAAVAGGSGGCSKDSAEVMEVVDGLLQLAGVICSDAA